MAGRPAQRIAAPTRHRPLALESHREIFEAIEARDPAAAGAAMRRHLDEIAKRYWNVRGNKA